VRAGEAEARAVRMTRRTVLLRDVPLGVLLGDPADAIGSARPRHTRTSRAPLSAQGPTHPAWRGRQLQQVRYTRRGVVRYTRRGVAGTRTSRAARAACGRGKMRARARVTTRAAGCAWVQQAGPQ
jgi:hypothetical protein